HLLARRRLDDDAITERLELRGGLRRGGSGQGASLLCPGRPAGLRLARAPSDRLLLRPRPRCHGLPNDAVRRGWDARWVALVMVRAARRLACSVVISTLGLRVLAIVGGPLRACQLAPAQGVNGPFRRQCRRPRRARRRMPPGV